MVLIAFVCVTPVLIFRMILPRCRVFHFVFLKLSQNSTTRYTILGGKHNNGNHINKKLTLYRNLRMDVVVRRGGLRDAPDREYREKSILLGVIHADPQAHIHLRGGNADHGSAASTSEARKRQHYARPGHVSFDERSHKLCTFQWKALGASG